MAPTKFLPGDLVLVNFPQYGYWPAQITGVLKKSKRAVKCFGEGERGEALPRDMIYFNYASMEANISKSSCDKDPARKKALMQIMNKFKKQAHKNNDDEPSTHKKALKQTPDKNKKQVLLNNNDEPTRKKALKQTSDKNIKQSLENNEPPARKEPLASKKALKQTSDKYIKQVLLNNNDEPTRKKAFKQTYDKYKKQTLQNSNNAKLRASKKAPKQFSDKNKKQVLQNNKDESNQKNGGGTKATVDMAGDHQVSNGEQNRAINDLGNIQLLKNLEDTKRNLDVETQKRIELENALEKIQSGNEIVKRRCPSDEEIEDIREKVKTDYKVKLEEIRVKLQADYEEKLEEICVKAHDDYEEKLQEIYVKAKADYEEKLKDISVKADYEEKLQEIRLKLQADYDEKLKEIRLKLQDDYEQKLQDVRVKAQDDYEQKLQEIRLKAQDDYEQKLQDVRVKVQDDYEEKLQEIRVKEQDDYEQKLQRFSSVHEQKIGDLEAWLCEEMSAAAGANRQIEEYKIMLENMAATVASLELLNESLEQNIKNHTHDLEDRTVKFKAEISSKFDEIKLLNDQVRQLKKEKEELMEKNIALEDEVSLMGEDQNNGRGMEIEGSYVNKIVNCRIM